MATIAISNLQPVGSEFFSDSENYLQEFEQAELPFIQGGASSVVPVTIAFGSAVVSAAGLGLIGVTAYIAYKIAA